MVPHVRSSTGLKLLAQEMRPYRGMTQKCSNTIEAGVQPPLHTHRKKTNKQTNKGQIPGGKRAMTHQTRVTRVEVCILFVLRAMSL